MFWENKRESVPTDGKHEKKMLKESLSSLKTMERTSMQKNLAFNMARASSIVFPLNSEYLWGSWLAHIC